MSEKRCFACRKEASSSVCSNCYIIIKQDARKIALQIAKEEILRTRVVTPDQKEYWTQELIDKAFSRAEARALGELR